MRTARTLSQIAAAVAAGSLVLSPVAAALAQTQTDAARASAPAAPAAPNAEAPQGPVVEPPSRVGRLARAEGTVSFHTADEDHWDPATLNYPVTSGDAFWTEPEALAAIDVGGSRITMASSTEFDVDQLDEHVFGATQPQGETFWDLRGLAQGDEFMLRTPRGTITISAAGRYGIFSGDTQSATTVSVLEGAAQLNADGVALAIPAGQTATVTGTGAAGDPFHGSLGPLVRTAFMDTMLAGEAVATVPPQQPEQPSATATATATATVTAAPPIVQQMPGGRDLASYGKWDDTAQYGRVWRPRVAADWVPYRQGRWAYVAPWGWTWIDDEPWGFAPFHYGRWVQADDGWAWAPTYYEPGFVTPVYATPVYAPALVGFFGVGPAIGFGGGFGIGVGIGFGFGFGFGSIGWAPLGWGEPFRPWFNGGPNYFNNVNRYVTRNVTNYNNITRDVTINNYANAATGGTVVPTAAMVASQRVASVAKPLGAAGLAQARPVTTTPTPTGATQGITPRQAQARGLPNANARAGAPAAPGPSLVGRATTAGAGGHGGASVPLRSPSSGGVVAAPPGTSAGGRATTAPGVVGHAVPGTSGAGAAGTRPGIAGGAPGAATGAATGALAGAAAARAGLPALRGSGAAAATTRAPGLGGVRAPTGSAPTATAPTATAPTATASARPSAPGPAITPRGALPGLGGTGRPNGLPGLRTPSTTFASANAPGGSFGTVPHGGTATGAATGAGATPRITAPGIPSRLPAAPAPSATSQASRAAIGRATPSGAGAAGLPPSRPTQTTPSARLQAPITPRAQPQVQPQYRPQYQQPRPQTQPQAARPQPQYQAPRYQAPQYQAPRAQPQYQQPRYQAPQYQAPRAQPQYQQPRYQAPPQYQAPRFQAPRFQAPQQFRGGGGGGGGRRPWPQ